MIGFMNLLKKVYLTIDGYDLVRQGEVVLCAVSGGPDSVVMLHALKEINEIQQADWKLHVAHINHGLRGKAAAEDQDFVRELAEKLGMPFHTTNIDVKKIREKKKLSMEEAGRNVRHQWLEETALKIKAQKIALAHNLDDQSETIMHRIIRGTGLRGLKGMAPIRLLSRKHDLFLVRPMLEVERFEIETFLQERGHASKTDLSNLDTSITRNRIRHKLLPMIEEDFNPRVKMALVKLGQTASSFYLLLREIAGEVYENTKMLSGSDEVCFNAEAFEKLPPAIQTLLIDRAVKTLVGTLPHLNFEHYLEVISLCGSGGYSKTIRLPKGLEARRESYILKIYWPKEVPPPPKISKIPLKVPGTTVIKKLNLKIDTQIQEGRVVGMKEYVRNKDYTEEIVDYEKVQGKLSIRLRRKGDHFTPLGGRGSCKLKKFFIDHKVPQPLRDRIPILADDDRIVWVVGYRIDNSVKITEDTLKVLKLRVSRLEEDGADE
jgi:tRNA(Ile)-lysidine synthase